MISLEPEIHSTYEDSADDYSVNVMDTEYDTTKTSKLHIQHGQSKFWVKVDSGSSTSLVTEQMAKDKEARDYKTCCSRATNSVELENYNDTPKQESWNAVLQY